MFAEDLLARNILPRMSKDIALFSHISKQKKEPLNDLDNDTDAGIGLGFRCKEESQWSAQKSTLCKSRGYDLLGK